MALKHLDTNTPENVVAASDAANVTNQTQFTNPISEERTSRRTRSRFQSHGTGYGRELIQSITKIADEFRKSIPISNLDGCSFIPCDNTTQNLISLDYPMILVVKDSCEVRYVVDEATGKTNREESKTKIVLPLILESTARQTYTVRELYNNIVDIEGLFANRMAIGNDKYKMFQTIDMALNYNAQKAILATINGMLDKKEVNGKTIYKYKIIGGLVVRKSVRPDSEVLVSKLVETVNDMINSYEFNYGDPLKDQSAADKSSINWRANIVLRGRNSTVTDNLITDDEVIRNDWSIAIDELASVKNNNDGYMLHSDSNTKEDVRACGYVSAIPIERPLVNNQGFQCGVDTSFMPHVIITSNYNRLEPSLGSWLLSIATVASLFERGLWSENLLRRPDELGATNIKFNYDKLLNQAANGRGEKIKFSSPDVTPDDIFNYIDVAFQGGIVLSQDIQALSTESSDYSWVVTNAAKQTNNIEGRNRSRQNIIVTANALSNGQFPLDYPLDKIFAMDGVVLPQGEYIDKKGQRRDIRELDLLTLMNDDNISQEEIYSHLDSMVPNPASESMPFVNAIKAIRSYGDAVVYGSYLRVTFHPEFIKTLVDSIANCGYKVQPNCALTPRSFNVNNNVVYRQLGNAFSGAALNGFNHQSIGFGSPQGMVFNKGAVSAGYGWNYNNNLFR